MQLLSASSADDTITAAVYKKQYSVAIATIYLSKIIIKTKEAYLVPCTDKTSEWDYRQHVGSGCLVNCNIIKHY